VPKLWLPVPHYQQTDDATCLATCARMVLAYLGDHRSEQELIELLGINPAFGAPGSHLLRLRQLGYHVTYDTLSFSLLRSALARDIPPIVLLRTEFLTYWPEATAHACVLVGLVEDAVFLHDPWLPSAPQQVTLTEFLAAWTEMDFLAAIISR